MDGSLIKDGDEISKELNKYFLSVFSQKESDRELEPVQIFRGQEVEKLSDIVICREVISKEINRLQKTKSPGPDDIFQKILKECRELVEPIAMIFGKSLATEVVARLWSQANVVPIFKKGDKAESSNYCPTSLTSVVDKMLEAIIAGAIRKHLDEHKLIRQSKHDFSKGKSCLTNLLSFYRKVFETIDKGDKYDIVYLDFSKALDRVPRRRLLSKVKAHDIGGKILEWIRGWLTSRNRGYRLMGRNQNGAMSLVGFHRDQY